MMSSLVFFQTMTNSSLPLVDEESNTSRSKSECSKMTERAVGGDYRHNVCCYSLYFVFLC